MKPTKSEASRDRLRFDHKVHNVLLHLPPAKLTGKVLSRCSVNQRKVMNSCSWNRDLVNTVSPLHTTFQRREPVFACPCLCKLVHVSEVRCHTHLSATSSFAFALCTMQYCIEHRSTVSLFQAQDVWKKKCKKAAVM